MKTLRTFVALEMPKAVEDQLSAIISNLKSELKQMPLRWVAVENIHLTLKFIGDTPEENIQQVSSIIEQSAKKVSPFEMQLNGLGVFPDARKPLVLWVGVTAPDTLAKLQEQIESGLAQMGYPSEDRPFNPHLTVARIRRESPKIDAKKIAAAMDVHEPISSAPVLIKSVTLFQSMLNQGGSVYNRLFTAPLDDAR